MGRRKRGRPVNGILLIDKPQGDSSNRALQRVRRAFDARKAGHTGSLDPLATGVLPICFGEATKLSGYLLDSDKAYTVTMRLGVKTDSGDAEGQVIDTTAHTAVDLQSAIAAFTGPIEQIPPMYSAVKHDGKRLYALARAGETVERKPRAVTIHALELTHQDDETASFRVECSKGTYIRTLMEDLAEAAGTLGHVTVLRRTQAGPFTGPLVALETVESLAGDHDALDALLQPMVHALAGWPTLRVNDDLAFFLRRGQPVQVPKAPLHGAVAIVDYADELIGIGEMMDDGRVAPRRILVTD